MAAEQARVRSLASVIGDILDPTGNGTVRQPNESLVAVPNEKGLTLRAFFSGSFSIGVKVLYASWCNWYKGEQNTCVRLNLPFALC